MEVIILFGFFEAFIIFVLLFLKKNRALSDVILSFVFLIYAINILLSYLEVYNRNHSYPYPFLINASVPLIILHGPALWFYIKSQTVQNFKFRKIYLLHFLPFLILFIFLSFEIFLIPNEEKILVAKEDLYKHFISYPIIVLSIALSSISYNIWSLLLIKKHVKKLKLFFSEISRINLQWLRTLLFAALISYGVIHCLYIIDLIYNFTKPGSLHLISFTIGAIYILFLGIYGHRQGNIFTNFSLNINKTNEEAEKDHSTCNNDVLFLSKLSEYMKKVKPYLNPELTIAKLADELNVNVDNVSFIINRYLKTNFFDFINSYRVEEFKKRCRDPKNDKITLLGIAFDSGFNSKATFNRVFKKATGLTPSEYKALER